MDKSPVLVGNKEGTEIPIYRLFKYFNASRDEETIHVYYEEYALVDSIKLYIPSENIIESKYYLIKNILAGEDPNETGNPLESNFDGFDNWYNYNIGGFPDGTKLGDVFVSAINLTLQGIPIGCKNGFTITQSE